MKVYNTYSLQTAIFKLFINRLKKKPAMLLRKSLVVESEYTLHNL